MPVYPGAIHSPTAICQPLKKILLRVDFRDASLGVIHQVNPTKDSADRR
jgi:hypothetical protein